ncbi:MAG: AAA family ATPase [Phycisphaerales bacterium]|nr:AAA family ATPase [Phycisphaerales bacterium]
MRHLKIVDLRINNIKRIEAAIVRPDPAQPLVVVSGKNGAGKSSLLDAITIALAGARNRDPKVLREGAANGSIELDLGELRVRYTTRRSATAGRGDNERLEVYAADGVKLASPQAVLDKLYSGFTFDPLAFTRLQPLQQREMLIDLLGLRQIMTELTNQREVFVRNRTAAREQAAALRRERDALPATSGARERRSADEILQQLAADNQRRADNAAKWAEVEQQQRAVTESEARVASADARITTMEAELEQLRCARNEAAAVLANMRRLTNLARSIADQLVDPPPPAAYQAQLADIERHNAAVAVTERREALEQQIIEADRVAANHQSAVETVDQTIRTQLANAKWPIPGMSFDAETGHIACGGIPFQQLSSAERIRISTAVGMGVNTELRIMRISDGSLLDADSMRAIEEMALDKDYQLWVERIEGGEYAGVYIEDGMVLRSKANNA